MMVDSCGLEPRTHPCGGCVLPNYTTGPFEIGIPARILTAPSTAFRIYCGRLLSGKAGTCNLTLPQSAHPTGHLPPQRKGCKPSFSGFCGTSTPISLSVSQHVLFWFELWDMIEIDLGAATRTRTRKESLEGTCDVHFTIAANGRGKRI